MRPAPLVLLALVLAAGACRESDGSREQAPQPDVAELAARGRALFFGRAGCGACHMIGDEGSKVRGPNLGVGGDFERPVARRARHPDQGPMAYLVESILDPDAYVVEGYARSVMKPPDGPPIALTNDEVVALAVFLARESAREVGAAEVRAARAAVGPARSQRRRRAEENWADELLSRVRWDEGEPARGRELYRRFGCGQCHGNEKNAQAGAPDLRGVGDRLSREALARWIVAPPETRMPSYDLYVGADDLDDLVAYLRARPAEVVHSSDERRDR